MADKLKFDTEKIYSFKTQVTQLRNELIQLKKTVNEDLKQLKVDWHTNAGVEFFENKEFNWEKQVEKYVELLECLEEMLEYAASQYSVVETKAKNLSC